MYLRQLAQYADTLMQLSSTTSSLSTTSQLSTSVRDSPRDLPSDKTWNGSERGHNET